MSIVGRLSGLTCILWHALLLLSRVNENSQLLLTTLVLEKVICIDLLADKTLTIETFVVKTFAAKTVVVKTVVVKTLAVFIILPF